MMSDWACDSSMSDVGYGSGLNLSKAIDCGRDSMCAVLTDTVGRIDSFIGC